MKFDLVRRLVLPFFLGALTALTAGCGRDPAPSAANRDPEPAAANLDARLLEVPALPGSTGPNLAAGPDGTLVLSWLEPRGDGLALQYAVLGASGWSEPHPVASGDDWFANWADFPSVTPLSDELWAAHWLARQPAGGYAYDVFVSLSTDGGATWSQAVKPHDDGTPTEHGFVSLFPRGNGAGLIWLDGRNTVEPPSPDGVANGMTLRAATVTREGTITDAAEIDGLTCDCCQTDVALTAQGAVAVYRDRTEGEIRDIYAARLADEGWESGRAVADDGWTIDGCPVNGPVIAADDNRLAMAWFTGADDRPRVRIVRSGDAGVTWSAPVDVAGGDMSGHAGIVLLPEEALAVSWVCERPGGGSGVCLRALSAADAPGPVHLVSGAADVPSMSVPQLARRGALLVAAWTEETDGGTRVASAAVPVASLH